MSNGTVFAGEADRLTKSFVIILWEADVFARNQPQSSKFHAVVVNFHAFLSSLESSVFSLY